MSTRDVTHLTDINKMAPEQDGSFNRRPSQFREWIERGGKYAPEKGKRRLISVRSMTSPLTQIGTISTSLMFAVSAVLATNIE